ncbi:MAG: ion channel [Candidatus Solibacter sp.]
MQRPAFDPGLTQKYTGSVRRVINKDGTFNVRRRGATWRDFHPYLHLINMGWTPFFASLVTGYLVVNTLFALAYFSLGPGNLQGADGIPDYNRFLNDFFFSAHTLSTVGYGSIWPKTLAANIIAAAESLVGVLGFAVATGLLFGRISRPSAKIGFSERMIVTAYQEIQSLQFRVVNRRRNDLMELEARVLLMTVEERDGQPVRRYAQLKLERDQVLFLPLTWTIVHPIDSESPLYGKTAEDLKRLQAEVLILLKAYDDTFSQTVLSRYSYRYDEIGWSERFAPAFSVDGEGDLVLELQDVGKME